MLFFDDLANEWEDVMIIPSLSNEVIDIALEEPCDLFSMLREIYK